MPRQKLCRNGPSNLTNVELIAVILGSGARQSDVFKISQRISSFLDENMGLLKKDYSVFLEGLSRITGMGPARSSQVAACVELCSRLLSKQEQVIKNARDAVPLLSYLSSKKQEYFVCINLNGGNRVISNRVVTIGLVDQALVHPREVFADALIERAAKVVVAHNHPGGEMTPSNEDVTITKKLVRASEILGITFLDHIIIANGGFFSFREEGMLDNCSGQTG